MFTMYVLGIVFVGLFLAPLISSSAASLGNV
jgi:hypothetical protein